MKFFAAFALIVAVASAAVLKPEGLSSVSQIEAIVAAIQSPSTDPATAALLEQQLADLIGVVAPSPVIIETIDNADISPAIVAESAVHPVIVAEQALPAHDGGALTEVPTPVAPVVTPVAPVVTPVAPASAASSPLVQVILNINAPAGAVDASPVLTPVAPVITPAEPSVDAVQVVDQAVESVDAVQVIDQAVESVIIPAPVVLPPAPIPAPVVPEPVVIGQPSLPNPIAPIAPVVTLPEILG